MTQLLASVSLLGAFLLFQVQPMISKFILPWFGGSPGVWTTCMLLFLVCMVCHGELARRRPAPTHLTEYYLLMSAGGALGVAARAGESDGERCVCNSVTVAIAASTRS